MQQGFRKGRQMMDNVYVLTQMVEIARKEGRVLDVVFMDIKGAYDRVRWEDIWDRLRKVGVGERCPLSPILFATVRGEREERIRGKGDRGFRLKDYGEGGREWRVPGLF